MENFQPSRDQLSPLLYELFALHENPGQISASTVYQHLLARNIPWHVLHHEIEAMDNPSARLYLRSIEGAYNRDFIFKNISSLNLHNRHDSRAFEITLYLLGLLWEPRFTLADFDHLLGQAEDSIRFRLSANGLNLKALLEKLADPALDPNSTAQAEVLQISQTINQVIFEQLGLTADTLAFFNLESHVLQAILSGNKMATPMALGSLFLVIARRLQLPFFGVNFPRHFLVKFESARIEFFVNVNQRGRLMYKSEVLQELEALRLPAMAQYLEPAQFDIIARRKIANLHAAYQELDLPDNFRFLESLSTSLAG